MHRYFKKRLECILVAIIFVVILALPSRAQQSGALYTFYDSAGNNVGFFDGQGNLIMLNGVVSTNGNAISDTYDNKWKLIDGVPKNIALVTLDGSSPGCMKVLNNIYECAPGFPPSSSHFFYLKNNSGNVVASIDILGNLYISNLIAPLPPLNLKLISYYGDRVSLQWTDQSSAPAAETKFEIERSIHFPDSDFQVIGSVSGNGMAGVISYTDAINADDSNIYYRVRAVRTSAKSTQSVYSFYSNVVAVINSSDLKNGSCESGQNAAWNWTKSIKPLSSGGNASVFWDGSIGRSGCASLKITNSKGAEAGFYQIVKLSNTTNHYFEAWVKTINASGFVGLKATWLDDNLNACGTSYQSGHPLTGNNDWTLMGMTLDTMKRPATAAYVKLCLQSDNNAGDVWFDDMRFVENLVQDPSFEENNTSKWTKSPIRASSSLTQDATYFYNGALSGKIDGRLSSETVKWEQISSCGVSPNSNYLFEAWIKTKTDRASWQEIALLAYKVTWITSSGGEIVEEMPLGGAQSYARDWHKVSLEFKSPSDVIQAKVSVLLYGGVAMKSWCYLDDVVFSKRDSEVDHLEVIASSDRATVNTPFVITVRAVNKSGEVCADYAGTITFDGVQNLSIDNHDVSASNYNYTYTFNDKGEKKFDISYSHAVNSLVIPVHDLSSIQICGSLKIKVCDPIMSSLRQVGKDIVNVQGQPVVMTGLNFTHLSMEHPYEINRSDLETLKNYGANCVRLAICWRDLMPTREALSDQYLKSGFEVIDTFLDWAEDNGIYVILNLRPEWGYTKMPLFNIPEDYSTDIANDIINDRINYARIWGIIAKRYKNRGGVILGYDIYNEPQNLKYPYENKNDELLWGAENDTALAKVYMSIFDAIRDTASDNNHMLIIESGYVASESKLESTYQALLKEYQTMQKSLPQNVMYSVHWWFYFNSDENNPPIYHGNKEDFVHSDSDNIYGIDDQYADRLDAAKKFQDVYNYPIYVGETSIEPRCGAGYYFKDNMEHPWYLGATYEMQTVFTRMGWSRTIWQYNTSPDKTSDDCGDRDVVGDEPGLIVCEGNNIRRPNSGVKVMALKNKTSIPFTFDRQQELNMLKEFFWNSKMIKADYEETSLGNRHVSAGDHNYPYTYADLSNNYYEQLTEVAENGVSRLSHVWTFNIRQGVSGATFNVEAFENAAADDNFIFEYSVNNGVTYNYMMTIGKTVDDNKLQTYIFPNSLAAGSMLVRVRDSKQVTGSKCDTLSIDHMYIQYQ